MFLLKLEIALPYKLLFQMFSFMNLLDRIFLWPIIGTFSLFLYTKTFSSLLLLFLDFYPGKFSYRICAGGYIWPAYDVSSSLLLQ